MKIEQVRRDVKEILDIGVHDSVKKLLAPMSKDEDRRVLSRIRRVCQQFNAFCNFFEAKEFEHPEGKPIRTNSDSGKFVEVSPCGKQYGGKTYLGIMIGDAALSSSVAMREDSIVCSWSFYNPAILVPSINEVIYGCESWWRPIGNEQLKKITESDINAQAYVKIFQKLAKDESNNED